MLLNILRVAMCMFMRTFNAVITPNEAEKKNIVEYYAKRDANTNDSLIALAKAEALASALASAKAKAKAEAKAEAKKQAFILETEPLNIILEQIQQEINAFKKITKTDFKQKYPYYHTSFTSDVIPYMEKKSPEIVERMKELYAEYNSAIDTFVDVNGSNHEFSYKKKGIFDSFTDCTCEYKPTCIFRVIDFGNIYIKFHFTAEFMEMFGFDLAEINRDIYDKDCAISNKN